MQKNELTMWEKISCFPVTAKMAVEDYAKQFVEDFKKDEGGLEVVQVVLVILVGVLMIVALNAVLGGWLGELWGIITERGTINQVPSGVIILLWLTRCI